MHDNMLIHLINCLIGTLNLQKSGIGSTFTSVSYKPIFEFLKAFKCPSYIYYLFYRRKLAYIMSTLTPQEAEEFWGIADKNGDGNLSIHEMKAALKTYIQQRKGSLPDDRTIAVRHISAVLFSQI